MHLPFERDVRHGIHRYLHLASRFYMVKLSLLVIGRYPHVACIHDVEQCLTGLHQLAYLNLLP